MKKERVKLAALGDTDTYRLSFPVCPERHEQFLRLFPGLPAIITTPDLQVVFGIDSFHFLQNHQQEETDILVTQVSIKEGLLLNFNLRLATTGMNIYEKLVFVHKILPHASQQEVYERTYFDLALNPEVVKNLDILLGDPFASILKNDKLDLQTAQRIANLGEENRKPMIDLFERIPFTRSQRWKILDMIEEILAGSQHTLSLDSLFRSLKLGQIPAREDPQQKILEALTSYRYPHLSRMEKEWQEQVHRMDIPAPIQVSHSPNFEKKGVTVRLKVKDFDALTRLVEKIKKENIY